MGALGGLLGSWMMNRSHALWRRLRAQDGGGGAQDRQGGSKEEAHPPSGDDAAALASHLIFGATLEAVRRALRRGR